MMILLTVQCGTCAQGMVSFQVHVSAGDVSEDTNWHCQKCT